MADERTVTLRDLPLGDGTYYPFASKWISGLGIPAARTSDQQRGHLSGDVGGDDVLPKRVITVSVGIQGDDYAADVANGTTAQEAAFSLLESLRTAWAPSVADIPLTVATGSYWTRDYYGRPRGIDADMERSCDGIIRCLLTFEALRPYAQGETVETPVGGGTLIANIGNAPLNNLWTLTLTPSASEVRISTSGQAENDLIIDASGVSTLLIGGQDRSVFADTVYSITRVQPGSGWMQLVPGNQTLTITGATGTISYPALYL